MPCELQLTPVDFGVPQDEMSSVLLRNRIEALEQAMLNMPEHQIEIEPVHHFSEGVYAREIMIPKGTTLTGKIHKFEHLNIISKGDISVLTENGIERLRAPCTLVSKPGTKRVGYAHEDTVWTTIHATKERDLAKIEAEFVVNSYLEFANQKELLEER